MFAGEQPWRWGKTWWLNEVAWLKFLIPVTLALNIPLSAAAVFKTAKRECRGLKATYRAFRYWCMCLAWLHQCQFLNGCLKHCDLALRCSAY